MTGDLAAFDAPVFSIQPAEAACIDPQERILLKTTTRRSERYRFRSSSVTWVLSISLLDSLACSLLEVVYW